MDLFKELLPSLNEKTDHLLETNPLEEKSVRGLMFMVNKAFSQGADTLLFANMMNRYHNLDARLQYDFYFHGLPKKKRYSKWAKPEQINNIEIVQEYYEYSDQRAREILKVLTDEQIEEIKKKLYKGETIK